MPKKDNTPKTSKSCQEVLYALNNALDYHRRELTSMESNGEISEAKRKIQWNRLELGNDHLLSMTGFSSSATLWRAKSRIAGGERLEGAEFGWDIFPGTGRDTTLYVANANKVAGALPHNNTKEQDRQAWQDLLEELEDARAEHLAAAEERNVEPSEETKTDAISFLNTTLNTGSANKSNIRLLLMAMFANEINPGVLKSGYMVLNRKRLCETLSISQTQLRSYLKLLCDSGVLSIYEGRFYLLDSQVGREVIESSLQEPLSTAETPQHAA